MLKIVFFIFFLVKKNFMIGNDSYYIIYQSDFLDLIYLL